MKKGILRMMPLLALGQMFGNPGDQNLSEPEKAGMDALKSRGLHRMGFGGSPIYGSTHSQRVKRKRLLAHNERQRRKKH